MKLTVIVYSNVLRQTCLIMLGGGGGVKSVMGIGSKFRRGNIGLNQSFTFFSNLAPIFNLPSSTQ
jgi:hypothetical protein